jgi:transcriptional regulator with XRE-family HTH domain
VHIVGKRLTALRKSAKLSQANLAKRFGIPQSNLNRYEHEKSSAPYNVLIKYADFFDVSLDYIFGRTDAPQGKLYDYNPQIGPDQDQMRQFIEMCFDPSSPMNARLKQMLLIMMEENTDGR